MTTLDAHLLALDMKTGAVVWDVTLEDYKIGYASTIAPLVVKDKVAYIQAGGGVVADSVPALEYQETVNKARAMMRAVEMAEKYSDGVYAAVGLHPTDKIHNMRKIRMRDFMIPVVKVYERYLLWCLILFTK